MPFIGACWIVIGGNFVIIKIVCYCYSLIIVACISQWLSTYVITSSICDP